MKAIILCAGYGSRMRPFSDNRHKTMINIGGNTLMYNIIQKLLYSGVVQFVIVLGYRDQELRDYIISEFDGDGILFEFVTNSDYRTTNNIYSLKLAFEYLVGRKDKNDYLVIESDLIFSKEIILDLIDDPSESIAAVDHYRKGMDGTVISLNNENSITAFIPPHLQDENFDYSDKFKTLNIYKFSNIFALSKYYKLLEFYTATYGSNSYYEEILGVLIYMKETVIKALIVNTPWVEVDNLIDVNSAEYEFDPKSRYPKLTSSFGGFWSYDVLDFMFIRNMYFPTNSMIAELKNNLPELLRNYGSKQSIINEKLSYYLLCDKENLLALNGATQAYPILIDLYKEYCCLVPKHTFGEYSKFNNRIEYSNETELLNLLPTFHGLVIIVTPNNPSGKLFNLDIELLISQYPEIHFLIDESFIDFSHRGSLLKPIEDKYDNAMILKSMSKTHGLPGIRLGYLYTKIHKVLAEFNKKLPIWGLNSMTEYYIEMLLKNRVAFESSIKQTISDREQFQIQLSELCTEFEEIPRVIFSQADFILIEVEQGVSYTLAKHLMENHKILVKTLLLDNVEFIRLAVRFPEENTLLINHIRNYLHEYTRIS